MRRRTKESQKRSKTIFLIILIAALISVSGTYAWFSTQRDVEIIGFRLNVEIAENLEISLDGERWTHSIQIENMRQFYGTYDPTKTYTNGIGGDSAEYAGTGAANAPAGTGDVDEVNTEVYQAKKDKHRNYIPTEILPVSTSGAIKDGNLLFAIGEVKDGKLFDIKACSESDITVGSTIESKEKNNGSHPYLVFDMYLRNLSRLSQTGDVLQLNEGSYVSASGKNTGLEYSMRVAFVKYGETVSIHDQSEDVPQKVRDIKATGEETVAIWEPNSKFHIPFVVSDDDRISSKIEAIETRAIVVEDGKTLPETIENIKSEDVKPEGATAVVSTNKPPQEETEDAMNSRKYATTKVHNLVQTDGNEMRLEANAITKVRCYVWLEGQDPDCVDLASTGDEVIITLRMIKPKNTGTNEGNSYAD